MQDEADNRVTSSSHISLIGNELVDLQNPPIPSIVFVPFSKHGGNPVGLVSDQSSLNVGYGISTFIYM